MSRLIAEFFFADEQMARKYAIRNKFSPIWALWQFYFASNNDKQANRLWKEFLSGNSHLRFQYVMNKARQNLDAELAEKLVEALRPTDISKKALGVAYSCWIGILSTQDKNYEALELIQRAVDDVTIANLNPTPLLMVRTRLEEHGSRFPFIIPN